MQLYFKFLPRGNKICKLKLRACLCRGRTFHWFFSLALLFAPLSSHHELERECCCLFVGAGALEPLDGRYVCPVMLMGSCQTAAVFYERLSAERGQIMKNSSFGCLSGATARSLLTATAPAAAPSAATSNCTTVYQYIKTAGDLTYLSAAIAALNLTGEK